MGYTLNQKVDRKGKVISYGSKKLSGPQQKWSTYDREFFALLCGVRANAHYLRHASFLAITNHGPLLSGKRVAVEFNPRSSQRDGRMLHQERDILIAEVKELVKRRVKPPRLFRGAWPHKPTQGDTAQVHPEGEATRKRPRKQQVENEERVEPVDTNQGDTNQERKVQLEEK